jgi:hypothetical protein
VDITTTRGFLFIKASGETSRGFFIIKYYLNFSLIFMQDADKSEEAIMKLKQISVPIENSHDRLYEITKALASKGITPRALTLVDNYGELRIVVSDLIAARQVLMQKNIPGRIDDVVAIEIENRPGHLSQIIEELMEAEINIKYSYAYAGDNLGKTIMIFCFSDNDKAIQVLRKKHIHALDYHTLGMLEAAA